MSKRIKPGSWCNIAAYLLENDPEMAELLTPLCLLSALERSPRRGSGVTFLLPGQKHPVREELKKLIEAPDATSLSKASDIVQAMIIRDCIKQVGDWRKTVDIPNFMFPSRKVVFVSAEGDKVTIKGVDKPCVLSKLKFVDGTKLQNLAIWQIESGVPSTTTDIAQVVKKTAPRGAKLGGYVPNEDEATRARFLIGMQCENEYAQALFAGKDCGCLALCAAGLVQFMAQHHPEEYKKCIGVLQRDESDFYILIEPHFDNKHAAFVSDEIITAWWTQGAPRCKDYGQYCDQLCRDIEALGLDHDAIADQISLACESCNPIGINKLYAEVSASGKIGSAALFAPALAEYYRQNPAMKQMHDELHFFLAGMFKPVDLPAFKESIQWIGDKMHSCDLHASRLTPDMFRAFTHSSAFMYVAKTVGQMADREKATQSLDKAMASKYSYASDYKQYQRHKRIVAADDPFNGLLAKIANGSIVLGAEDRAKLMAVVTAE